MSKAGTSELVGSVKSSKPGGISISARVGACVGDGEGLGVLVGPDVSVGCGVGAWSNVGESVNVGGKSNVGESVKRVGNSV